MPKKYAAGADAKILGAFETTAGTIPTDGYRYLDAVSTTLSPEQPLERRTLLGRGRDPGDPYKGRRTVTGDFVIPMDARNLGFWLKGLLGAPTTTDTKAAGYIQFSGQPAANATLTFNGTAVTAKASGATGAQFNIGTTVDETVTNACTMLNASVDAELAKCTYTPNTTLDRIEIEFDTVGTGGNAFTLAVSTSANATLSAATLLAGGYKHVWLSGSGSLPTMAIEVGFPELIIPTFSRYNMVSVGEFNFAADLDGPADATVRVMAQNRSRSGTTIDASPLSLDLDNFSQSRGIIEVGDTLISGVMSGNFAFNNTLDPLFTRREDALMDEATPTIVSCTGDITARLESGSAILALAEADEPTQVIYGYSTPRQWSLSLRMPRCIFSTPKEGIPGPGGVDMTFNWEGARDSSLGALLEATLINDVAGYA